MNNLLSTFDFVMNLLIYHPTALQPLCNSTKRTALTFQIDRCSSSCWTIYG